MIEISDYMSYIPSSEQPLSADVGIIKGKNNIWLYDVGNGDDTLSLISDAVKERPVKVVISHFHPDHMGNLPLVKPAEIYLGANTRKYTGAGNIVDKDIYFDDGVKIHLFPLPSSHAKGSVGMEVNGEYAWLGDGLYTTTKNGMKCYNAGVLLEEIKVLKSLDAKYFLLSHQKRIIREKEHVIEWLEKIYASRKNQEAYIIV